MTTLTDELVPEELWALAEPLLPVPPRPLRWQAPCHLRSRLLGRDRVHGPHVHPVAAAAHPRAWLCLAFDLLASAHRVAAAGVFEQLHLAALDRLGGQGQLDWSRVSVDTMSVRARRGGITWAQIPSTVASLEASSTWSVTAMGCR